MEKVIFLHGFTETLEMWDTVKNLNSSGRTVIYVDVNSFFETINDLTTVAEHLLKQYDDTDKLYLLGHSMGGYIALQMMMLSSRVKALCLIHSNPFADSEEKKQSRAKQIRFIEEYGRKKYMETTIPNLFLSDTSPDIVQNQIDLTAGISETQIMNQLKAMMDRKDSSEAFKNFYGYKQVCLGMKDPLMNYQDSLTYIKDFNQLSLNLSEQAGHMSYVEDTAFFVNSVDEFLIETKTLD